MKDEILERMVFHQGKTIMNAGETHADAYIVQKGEVIAYIMENTSKIEVARYGVDAIIAETNLLLDSPQEMSYEAATDTTVVRVSRQNFEKKLTKLGPTVMNIIVSIVKKVKALEDKDIQNALKAKNVDDKAKEIVDYLLRDMPDSRKTRYEDAILPHFNVMIKALEDLRTKERFERQQADLNKKLEQIKKEDEAEKS